MPLAVLVGLLLLGFHSFSQWEKQNPGQEVTARVLTVDNEEVQSAGAAHIGHQALWIRILTGPEKGREYPAANLLTGHNDVETLLRPGDKIIAALMVSPAGTTTVKAVDLYRQDSLFILFGLFVAALLIYARMVGVKALISFILTLVILWQVLVRYILAGVHPLAVTALTLVLLSGVIIFLVAGWNRKGLTAFLGTLSGLGISLALIALFGGRSGLLGMTQPHVNALIFAGFHQLDIQAIFYSAVVLGASGAAMDVSVDIAAAMGEIQRKKPDIPPEELVQSGINVGRQVMGTMTTTLLLAYAGGYLTLLLLFQVQSPSPLRMLNLQIVAAEIMRILVGSTGLVLVAPITAFVGGYLLTRPKAKPPSAP